jgi:hypothetical protein
MFKPMRISKFTFAFILLVASSYWLGATSAAAAPSTTDISTEGGGGGSLFSFAPSGSPFSFDVPSTNTKGGFCTFTLVDEKTGKTLPWGGNTTFEKTTLAGKGSKTAENLTRVLQENNNTLSPEYNGVYKVIARTNTKIVASSLFLVGDTEKEKKVLTAEAYKTNSSDFQGFLVPKGTPITPQAKSDVQSPSPPTPLIPPAGSKPSSSLETFSPLSQSFSSQGREIGYAPSPLAAAVSPAEFESLEQDAFEPLDFESFEEDAFTSELNQETKNELAPELQETLPPPLNRNLLSTLANVLTSPFRFLGSLFSR